MIAETDLTYVRYQSLPFQGKPAQTKEPLEGEGLAIKDKKPADNLSLPVGSVGDQLRDMVERLNKKASAYQQEVRFELDVKKGQVPWIHMVNNMDDSKLGSYHAGQLIDLERSLFDMAGFRLSVEG